MNMIYDSEAFVVVYVNVNEADALNKHNFLKAKRECYEIVDKRTNKTLLLDGEMAAAFLSHINRWHAHTPAQEDVEEVLDSYCALAQLPLVVH